MAAVLCRTPAPAVETPPVLSRRNSHEQFRQAADEECRPGGRADAPSTPSGQQQQQQAAAAARSGTPSRHSSVDSALDAAGAEAEAEGGGGGGKKDKKKKKKKAGPPSAEMQALLRSRRERERALKTAQREAREGLVRGMREEELDALEEARIGVLEQDGLL